MTTSSGPALVTCTGGSLNLIIAGGGAVTGLGTLSGCVAPGQSGLTSAKITVKGNVTTKTRTSLVLSTSDLLEWNIGTNTTLEGVRTITGAVGVVAEVGTGNVVKGLFSSAKAAEAATGTRKDQPTGQLVDLNFTSVTVTSV
jgi:hypothetical protein